MKNQTTRFNTGFISRRNRFLAIVVLLAGLSEAADYELIMPLQYNRYQPLSAEILGMANSGALTDGSVNLFDNPARLLGQDRFQSMVSSSFISGNQSHVLIKTNQSLRMPSLAATTYNAKRYSLGLGIREVMNMDMSYPDQWKPAAKYEVAISVKQVSAGGGYEISPGIRAGASVNYLWSDISWSQADTSIVQGRADGISFNAGIVIGISPEFFIFTQIRSEGKMQGFTEFKPDPGSDLELYGMVPALSSFGVSYMVDSGFTVAGQIDITGWQNVSWDYAGRADLKFSALWQVIPEGYSVGLGFFTMRTPLEEIQIGNYPEFHHMYFISAGQSFIVGNFTLAVGGATSRLFSRPGLKQDMLALSLEYNWK